MNERPADDPQLASSDELLAAHLRRRGGSPAPAELTRSVLARVAETTRERRWRLTVATWRPRLALAAGGVAVVLLASLLLAAPPGPDVGVTPGPGSSTLDPNATGLGSEFVWDPTQRALTPPEFLRVLASQPGTGVVLIVDDQLIRLNLRCPAAGPCASGQLVNAGLNVSAPAGGHLPESSSEPIPGPLAIQIGEDSRLVFLGSVVSNGTRLEFSAKDLAQRNAMGGLFVIPAWIHRGAIVACPSIAAPHAPLPTSELGLPAPEIPSCGGIYSGGTYLTDADPGPPPYGIGGGDPNAFPVQQEAYQRFATDATADGGASRGVYLVRDWAGYGEILTGMQPLGIPTVDATPPTTTPTPPAAAPVVLSLDELMAQARGGGLPPGSIAVVDVPSSAVLNFWEPGVAHTCPQLCLEWGLRLGDQVLHVVVSMQAPMPDRPVGIQAFHIEPDGSLRALGPATTGPDGRTADPLSISTDGSLAVVHGWLRAGPVLPCPQPAGTYPIRVGLLGEPLKWSQCYGTWILPSAADPWAGPPNNVTATDGSGTITIGDLSVPAGTLHVQDGGGDATSNPREGSWLVRSVITNACPSWASCPPPVDGVTPATHVTWWELVGPVLESQLLTTSATPSPPAQSVGPKIWTSAELGSVVVNGPLAPGTLAIVDGTIQLDPGVSSRPARGDPIGLLDDLRVYWGSDASLGPPPTDPGRFAVRVRADRALDYLGPALLDDAGLPLSGSATQARALGHGAEPGLYVVHGWRYLGPPLRCRAPQPLASGQHKVTGLGAETLDYWCTTAYLLPSAVDPYRQTGGGASFVLPDGALILQDGAFGPPTTRIPPTEGFYLVRYVPCPVTPAFDSCDVLPVTPNGSLWELVGTLTSPAPVSP